MDTLESVIKAHINTHGPMDISTFMGLALGHPTYGYYMTRDPLGAEGDFTTAPEISQLFGEMIGLCLADYWLRAGAPLFHLVEFGGGRGTLMADILRATKNVPGFHSKLKLHMVETSPVLRAKQNELLAVYNPVFHDSADTLPQDAPLYMVANEFFDALPIRQAISTPKGWMERVVGLDNDNLVFGLISMANPPTEAGTIFEWSPIRENVMQHLSERIKTQGGLLLAIDYGHDTQNPNGDTLQAVYKHQFCDVLAHIGHADITSHVDFYKLKTIAQKAGCFVLDSITQKDFLENLGILVRLQMLNAPQLDSGVKRLLDPAGMGSLFRVLAVTCSPLLFPAGFDNPHGTAKHRG
jgi:NADH dehydrogenase [ubiquinone] 1 alpha subcomplex assembly factor 7